MHASAAMLAVGHNHTLFTSWFFAAHLEGPAMDRGSKEEGRGREGGKS